MLDGGGLDGDSHKAGSLDGGGLDGGSINCWIGTSMIDYSFVLYPGW